MPTDSETAKARSGSVQPDCSAASDFDDSDFDDCCSMCGGDGVVELADCGPSEWGEDCFCEENRLVTCPECRERERYEAAMRKRQNDQAHPTAATVTVVRRKNTRMTKTEKRREGRRLGAALGSALPKLKKGIGWTIWHSVAVELPDDDMTVLLALSDGEVWTGFMDAGDWRFVCGELVDQGEGTRVTHWAEFPDPPNTKLTDPPEARTVSGKEHNE